VRNSPFILSFTLRSDDVKTIDWISSRKGMCSKIQLFRDIRESTIRDKYREELGAEEFAVLDGKREALRMTWNRLHVMLSRREKGDHSILDRLIKSFLRQSRAKAPIKTSV
jgi:hypothetical protein